MKHTALFRRLTAAALTLTLLISPAAALTPAQARDLLEANYLEPLGPEVLDQATIPQMLEALGDPYTEYLTAQEYADFLATMADPSTGGIGVTCVWTEEGLEVTETAPDSPAQQAGIQPGDLLVTADGVDLAGMDMDQAVEKIRGEVGSPLVVVYLRDGVRRRATLTRTEITLPATQGTLLEGGVGLITCNTWGEETPGHFRQIIRDLGDQVGCWLIDLRSNTGGITEAASECAGMFCGQGTMVYLRLRDTDPDSDGYTYRNYPVWSPALTDKPAILLTDDLTASASESFAAALRDYGRALIVGQRTYGKGVAQRLWDKDADPELFADGDCMKITVARFFSPAGNTNHTVGVIPDFPYYAPEDALDIGYTLALAYAEGYDSGRALADQFTDEALAAFAFDDTADSPYEPSITAMAAYGMVAGGEDGQFHPTDTLTRAQLAQLLLNALNGWVSQRPGAYTDVAEDAWYAQAVNTISDMGFMMGTGEDRFSPEDTLDHQQLFTVLGRLARWLNDDLDMDARSADAGDWELKVLESYASWAKPSVWLLSCSQEGDQGGLVNLLWAQPEDIDPTAPATREEAVDALYSVLYYLNILP